MAMNILLELDELNEWVFSVVSPLELKAKIRAGDKRIRGVKRKKSDNEEDSVLIKVFYAETKSKDSDAKSKPCMNSDGTFPIESVFVKEEDGLFAEIKEEIDDDDTEICEVSEPKPVSKPSENVGEGTVVPVANVDITPVPSTFAPVGKPKGYYRYNCEKCGDTFERRHRLMDHIAKERCFKRLANGIRHTVIKTMSYLPPGLVLPDLNNLKLPYNEKIAQADGTFAYIYQKSVNNFLWVTNFDLFGTKKCDMCDGEFTHYFHLLSHRREDHFFPGKITCNGCQKRCETLKERKLHSLYCLKKDQLIPHFCYDCNLLFNDLKTYKVHLYQKHPPIKEERPRRYSCDICKKAFQTATHLKTHVKFVHEKFKAPEMYCAHCPTKLQNRNSIIRHLVSKHFPQMAEVTCDLCPTTRYFTKMTSYLHHMTVTHRHVTVDQDSVMQMRSGIKAKERPVMFEHPNSVLLPQEVLQEPVRILDSDETETEETFVVVSEQNPGEIKSKQRIKIKVMKSYPQINGRTNLDYLPEGLELPELTDVVYPLKMEVLQSDGTVIYLQQSSFKSVCFITNFELQPDGEPNSCDLCGITFKGLTSFLQHRLKFHFFPTNIPNCVACHKTFDSTGAKQRHSYFCLEKSKIDVGFCYICNTQLENFIAFRQHLMAYHPTINTQNPNRKIKICPICGKPVNINTMSLEMHIITHNDRQPYKCDHCDNAYSTRRCLLNHLKEIHFTTAAKHSCTDCIPNRFFNETGAFVKHLNVIHGGIKHKLGQSLGTQERFKCTNCPREFAKHVHLQYHMRSHVPKPKVDLVQSMCRCDICGKVFAKQSSLLNHKKSHIPESERPLKCQYCGKGYNSTVHLIEHERQHTGEKPFVCSYCQKAFAKRQTYNDHVNTHTGKGYKCNHCERMLWDHSSFRKHLKSHEAKLGIKLTYNRDERRLKDMGLLDKVKDLLSNG